MDAGELLQNPAVQAALAAVSAAVFALIVKGVDIYVAKTPTLVDDGVWSLVKRVILRRGKK
jgi:hypothetical protein